MGPYRDNIGTKRAIILWSPDGFCNFLFHGSHMGSGMARTGPFSDTMGTNGLYDGAQIGFANDLAWVPRGFRNGAHMRPVWDSIGLITGIHYGAHADRFCKWLWHGSHVDLDMGPTWYLSGTTLAPCGLPLWSPDGFANDFGMSPTLFRYGGRMGPFWDNMSPVWATVMVSTLALQT